MIALLLILVLAFALFICFMGLFGALAVFMLLLTLNMWIELKLFQRGIIRIHGKVFLFGVPTAVAIAETIILFKIII